MEDLCDRPPNPRTTKPGHGYLRNIDRNMHKAQLFPLSTDTEETHESLSAVQLLTNSKEQFLFVNGSKKNTVTFCGKTNLTAS